MNIQAEKIHLVLETENPKIIESIKKIFKKYKTADFWNDLSFEQKEEIDKASIKLKWRGNGLRIIFGKKLINEQKSYHFKNSRNEIRETFRLSN